MEKEQIKNHKETVEKVLYEKDFYTESKDGRRFPKNKIKAEYVKYSGERLDKDGNYKVYEWDKVVITVAKLTTNDGNLEVAKKIMKNAKWESYIVDDKKEIILSTEEFQDLLASVELDLE